MNLQNGFKKCLSSSNAASCWVKVQRDGGDPVRATLRPQTHPEAHCEVTSRARGPSGLFQIEFGAMGTAVPPWLITKRVRFKSDWGRGVALERRPRPSKNPEAIPRERVAHSICREVPLSLGPKRPKAQSQGPFYGRQTKSLSQRNSQEGTLIPTSSCCHMEEPALEGCSRLLPTLAPPLAPGLGSTFPGSAHPPAVQEFRSPLCHSVRGGCARVGARGRPAPPILLTGLTPERTASFCGCRSRATLSSLPFVSNKAPFIQHLLQLCFNWFDPSLVD